MSALSVYIEVGNRRIFACAVDWPGWARAGRTPAQALAALAAYAPRYAPVAAAAGLDLAAEFDVDAADPAGFEVVETVQGSATTDFGAPGALTAADAVPATPATAARDARLVESAWARLADAAATAPPALRKGPRGGGRDRDAIVRHVLEAESAYAGKLGVRLPRTTPDDEEAARSGRARVLEAVRAGGAPATPRGWPTRYAARRFAWHALDHAWEIEDRH